MNGEPMKATDKASETAAAPAWHALSAADVLARLEVDDQGLSGTEVDARRARYGWNRLPPPPRRSALVRLAGQFHNVLIYVLLIAGAVTSVLGHWIDAGVIFGVVVINAVIGFLQEGKAERALEAVRNLLSPRALVTRDGAREEIEASELVPGDVVLLQSGDRVPADLRLLKVRELQIDESLLTGESAPVSKDTAAVAADAAVADRSCQAFSGSLVTYGQGVGVVVGTGAATEIGRISTLLSHVQTLTTPLLRKIAQFGRWLTGGILALAAAMFGFGVGLRDYAAADMFLAAVGLAVAAIPEGLPAIITITLAIGVQRMARRNAIIRRLPAVETLGSVTVICSDKTGTLTRNEMTVQAVVQADCEFAVEGEGYDARGSWVCGGTLASPEDFPGMLDTCRAALLCNDATVHHEDGSYRFGGNPMEAALAVLAVKGGLTPARELEELPRVDTIPFESQHKFMATLHHDHAGHAFGFVKGAPEVLLPRCHLERCAGQDQPLRLDYWEGRIERMARQGYRTLALAARAMPRGQRELAFGDVDGGLTLLAVVGLLDPPRDEAVRAVAACQAAGIGVKMITGDHAITAVSIAERMGIGKDGAVITGAEMEALDDDALAATARGADVFARVSPEHKLRLVRALQAAGEVTAMTGDGVNDAPALKRADVGVAMGVKGTEAAKEAAEMVLADDNFASIAAAVEEGRTVFDNIRKSILFILPTNGGEALIILAAVLLGRLLPVTPAQILWVNMITAVTLALSLAFEPPEARVMERAPRDPAAPLLSGFMLWRIGFVAVLMVAGAFGLFLFYRAEGVDIETARTVAVNTLVLAEAAYLFNSRFITEASWTREGLLGSRPVLLAVALVIGFQFLFTYLPVMQHLFQTRALTAGAWAWMFGVAVVLFLAVEVEKSMFRRFARGR